MLYRKILLISSIVACAFALDVPENKIVDTKWLKENIDDRNLVLVDLRDDKGGAFIPGAIDWHVDDFREYRFDIKGFVASPIQFERLIQQSGITDDKTIVFYSEGNKSATDYIGTTSAVYVSEVYGLKNTAILNGGYAAWIKDGGKTAPNAKKPAKSEFKITEVNSDLVATVYDIDNAVVTGDWILMDGRSDSHFKGETAHSNAAKNGHIRDAHSVFIGKFVEKKDGIFYMKTDKSSVVNLINSAGGDVTKPTIWYCNAGFFATGGWFMSKYTAGTENVTVYDGSMFEYSRLPKREVLKSEPEVAPAQ